MRSGIVLISHDRRLLERLSRITVWLDRGITRQLDAGFAGFEAWRDTVLEQEEIDRHKLGRKIVMEEDWLRYGVTARRKRNQKRLADLHALRKKRKELRGAAGDVKLRAAEAELSGRLVAVAEGVTKAFGDRVVVRDFSTRILRGDRVGIVGPNGAGKTTLLNLLTGELAPDAGEVKLGTNLAAGDGGSAAGSAGPDADVVADVDRRAPATRVTVAGQNRHVIGYMKDFLFAPEQANTPVGVLSGGERGAADPGAGVRQTVEFDGAGRADQRSGPGDAGTAAGAAGGLCRHGVAGHRHDRDFIDRVVTSVIATEGDGRWIEYAGGYSDMLAQRGPVRVAQHHPRPGLEPRRRPPDRPAESMTFKDRHALETLPGRIAGWSTMCSTERGAGRPGPVREEPGAVRSATQGIGSRPACAGGGRGTVAGAGDAARGTGADLRRPTRSEGEHVSAWSREAERPGAGIMRSNKDRDHFWRAQSGRKWSSAAHKTFQPAARREHGEPSAAFILPPEAQIQSPRDPAGLDRVEIGHAGRIGLRGRGAQPGDSFDPPDVQQTPQFR